MKMREFVDQFEILSFQQNDDGSLLIGQFSEQVSLSPENAEKLKRFLAGEKLESRFK